MRIFSSGVHLRRVAALTLWTKDLVCSVRSSAASGFPTDHWVTPAPFLGTLPSVQEFAPLSFSRVLQPSDVSHFR